MLNFKNRDHIAINIKSSTNFFYSTVKLISLLISVWLTSEQEWTQLRILYNKTASIAVPQFHFILGQGKTIIIRHVSLSYSWPLHRVLKFHHIYMSAYKPWEQFYSKKYDKKTLKQTEGKNSPIEKSFAVVLKVDIWFA